MVMWNNECSDFLLSRVMSAESVYRGGLDILMMNLIKEHWWST